MTDAGGHNEDGLLALPKIGARLRQFGGVPMDTATFVAFALGLQAVVATGILGDGVVGGVAGSVVPIAVVGWGWLGLRSIPANARGAWAWLLGGLALWVIGDLGWTAIDIVASSVPSVSVADVAYVAGYPALAIGVGRLVKLRSPHLRREDTIDSITLAVAGCLFAWFTMVAPVRDDTASLLVQGLLAGYPLGDGLLLAAVGWVMFSPGKRCRSLVLTLGFVIGSLVLDVAYFVSTNNEAEGGIRVVNALYPLAYLFLGLAIRDKSVSEATEAEPQAVRRVNPVRLAMSGATMYLAPVVAYFQGRAKNGSALVMLLGSVALTTLVLVRLIMLVREREAMEQAAAHRSLHDRLTGFPNRELFVEFVQQAQARKLRTGSPVAVLFLDLDRFKSINDTWGHAMGDSILLEAARTMRACVRTDDVLARVGGDEFAILCEGADESIIGLIAHRIVSALPSQLREEASLLSASVGIAVSPANETVDAETLMHRADLAMYRSKAEGGRSWKQFDDDMASWAAEQRMVEADLAGALKRGEMRLAYQPILQLDPAEVVGVEALLRWDRPGSGSVSPAAFIPIAEATGLIVPIGEWVMYEACRFAAQHENLYVTMNVSAVQINRSDIVSTLQSAIAASGVQPERLVVELTESALVTNVDKVKSTLERLVLLGVKVAIDDFGTGYSSLAYLDRFPVSTVKVDRSLVDRIESDSAQGAVVKAVVGLAPTLGFTVVAEGVERESQREALAALGVPMCQGWLFAPALTPERLEEYLSGFQVAEVAVSS